MGEKRTPGEIIINSRFIDNHPFVVKLFVRRKNVVDCGSNGSVEKRTVREYLVVGKKHVVFEGKKALQSQGLNV